VVYSGYQPGRGTVQVPPVKGDLLFQCSWNSKEEYYSISQFDGEKFNHIDLMEESHLWEEVQKLNPWMEEFLTRQGRTSSFIPFTGDTLAQAAKRRRLMSFFERYNIPELEKEIELFMTSAKSDLNLDPRKEDLSAYVPENYAWDGSVVDIHRFERWFAITKEGTQEIQTNPKVTTGSNWAHSSSSRQEGESIVFPEGTTIAIRIGYGQRTHRGHTHYSYGRSVDVYIIS
jgi:hypothetical protein